MRVAAVVVLAALAPAAAAAGCSATSVQMHVDHDPIPAIVASARESGRWNIDEAGEGTAELTETWFVHSFVVQGLTRFHAELDYTAPTLSARFFVKSRGATTFGLAQRVDLYGDAQDAPEIPRMRISAKELLDWGGVPAAARPAELR